MKHRIGLPHLGCTVLLLASLSAHADEVVSQSTVAEDIAIENIRQDGALLSATIVNRGDHYIRDIEIGVTYNWLWSNEFKPGPVSPGWASTVRIPDTLAPGEAREFRYSPAQSTEARSDGTYHPTVAVTRYERYNNAPPNSGMEGSAGSNTTMN